MAGIAYLAMLHPLDGFGGQGPVFYNLLVASAAWLVIGGWHDFERARFVRRYYGAMLLCALALTIKQTAVFEAIFLGLAGLYRLHRSGLAPAAIAQTGVAALAIGLAPTAAIAGWYAAHGWGEEWSNAMFTSNLERQSLGRITQAHNLYAVLRLIAVFLGCALLGLLFGRAVPAFARYRALMAWWLFAALLGFAVIANAFTHYLLPLLVPLTPLAAIAYARRGIGPAPFAATIVVAAILGTIFDFEHYRRSNAMYWSANATLRSHMTEGRLLVFAGPPLLYATSGATPMSPLVFPNHLYDPLERNVSHLDTLAELQRVLAAQPEVIVTRLNVAHEIDPDVQAALDNYLAARCRMVWKGEPPQPRRVQLGQAIYACS